MTDLLHAAKLTESSVQRVARDELDDLPTTRERAHETRPRTTRATTRRKTHDTVMLVARLIVSGNVHGYSRIELVDESTVIVR